MTDLVPAKPYKHTVYIGQQFGNWTVVSDILLAKRYNGGVRTVAEVRCVCGTVAHVYLRTLRIGTSKSCGDCTKRMYSVPREFLNRTKGRAVRKKWAMNVDIVYLSDIFDKQNGKCALSGILIGFEENTASLDRIDSSKGYIRGNVQWVHIDINYAKSDFTQEHFIELCKQVTENNK